MKVIIAQFSACAVLCYFAYHALAGEQGLAEWAKLQKREKLLIEEIAALLDEKTTVTSQIERLKSDHVDLDFVEELAREKLAYAKSDELVLYTDGLR